MPTLGHHGPRNGTVDVACYCGATVNRMTWTDVWTGTPVPHCTPECHDLERNHRATDNQSRRVQR